MCDGKSQFPVPIRALRVIVPRSPVVWANNMAQMFNSTWTIALARPSSYPEPQRHPRTSAFESHTEHLGLLPEALQIVNASNMLPCRLVECAERCETGALDDLHFRPLRGEDGECQKQGCENQLHR